MLLYFIEVFKFIHIYYIYTPTSQKNKKQNKTPQLESPQCISTISSTDQKKFNNQLVFTASCYSKIVVVIFWQTIVYKVKHITAFSESTSYFIQSMMNDSKSDLLYVNLLCLFPPFPNQFYYSQDLLFQVNPSRDIFTRAKSQLFSPVHAYIHAICNQKMSIILKEHTYTEASNLCIRWKALALST